eukprot:1244335-Pyramimonas_sp.AAC.1
MKGGSSSKCWYRTGAAHSSEKFTTVSMTIMVDVPGRVFWRDVGLPGRKMHVDSRCRSPRNG